MGVRPLLDRNPEHKALLVECLRERARRPVELRHTVPKRRKRKLCELAVANVVELHRQEQDAALQIEESLRRSRAGAEAELRHRGWTDEQIAAWVEKLRAAAQRRAVKDFKMPGVDKVLEIANRRAPPIMTLRRKAAPEGYAVENHAEKCGPPRPTIATARTPKATQKQPSVERAHTCP